MMELLKIILGICLLRLVSSYHGTDTRIGPHIYPNKYILLMSSSVIDTAPSIKSSSNQRITDDSIKPLDNRPYYATAPLSNRWDLGKKLTLANRKYSDMGLKLRTSYIRLRKLTSEEEMTAGKFSNVGKRMDKIFVILKKKYSRDPTELEWANACKINVDELAAYQKFATSARSRLVQHNMRIVDFWVRKILEHSKAAKNISYYELVIEGVKGLSEASREYDGRGPFIKFAQHHVRARLYKGLTTLRPGMCHTSIFNSYGLSFYFSIQLP